MLSPQYENGDLGEAKILISALKEEIRSLRTELLESRKESAQHVQDLTETMRRVQEEALDYSTQLVALREELGMKNAELSAKAREAENALKNLVELRDNDAVRNAERLQKEKLKLQEELASLQRLAADGRSARNDISQFQSEIVALKKALAASERKLKDALENSVEINRKFVKLESEHKLCSKVIENLRDEVSTSLHENDLQKKDIFFLQNKLDIEAQEIAARERDERRRVAKQERAESEAERKKLADDSDAEARQREESRRLAAVEKLKAERDAAAAAAASEERARGLYEVHQMEKEKKALEYAERKRAIKEAELKAKAEAEENEKLKSEKRPIETSQEKSIRQSNKTPESKMVGVDDTGNTVDLPHVVILRINGAEDLSDSKVS